MQDADNGYMNEVEEEAAIPDYAYDYNCLLYTSDAADE